MFAVLQVSGLTVRSSRLAFTPKYVVYFGLEITAEGVSVGEDRIKAIHELISYQPPPAPSSSVPF